jgi:hypothetical protein
MYSSAKATGCRSDRVSAPGRHTTQDIGRGAPQVRRVTLSSGGPCPKLLDLGSQGTKGDRFGQL